MEEEVIVEDSIPEKVKVYVPLETVVVDDNHSNMVTPPNFYKNNNRQQVNSKPNNGRQQVDNAIDQFGSEALKKMGVPEGVANKAVKNNGGALSPMNMPGNKMVKNYTRDKMGSVLDKSGMSSRLQNATHNNPVSSLLNKNDEQNENSNSLNNDSSVDNNASQSTSGSAIDDVGDVVAKAKKVKKIWKYVTIFGGSSFFILFIGLIICFIYVKMVGGKFTDDVKSGNANVQESLQNNPNKKIDDFNVDETGYIGNDIYDDYAFDGVNVQLVSRTGDLTLDDITDLYGGKTECNDKGECTSEPEKRFFLKMYDLYYLYLSKYNVKLDLSMLMATLTYKTSDYNETFIYNLSYYDRAKLIDSDWGREEYDGFIGLEWDYDYEHPSLTSSYLVMNDASTDMQVLAKNMVAKITEEKCKKEDGSFSKTEKVKDYEENITCGDGEELVMGDSTYELDLDKFDDFLLIYINRKYYNGVIGFPGWMLGIQSLPTSKNNPSIIKIIDNKSTSSNSGTIVNNSNIVNKLNNKAKEQVGKGGYEYRRFLWPNGEGDSADWCAAFISWLFNEVLPDKQIIYYNGYAGEIPRKSIENNFGGTWFEDECTDSSSVPQAGDLILFDPYYGGYGYVSWPNTKNVDSDADKYTSSHIGYIYKVDDEYVYTYEGNSYDDLGNNVVVERKYSRKNRCGNTSIQGINGYFRPNYSLIDSSKENTEKKDNDVLKSTSTGSNVGSTSVVTSSGFKNKIIYYNQYDYSSYPYGYVGTIASHGCGPTSLAIVISSLLQEEHNPVELTNYMCANYSCSNDGSNWRDIPKIEQDYADKYGFKTAQVGDLDELRRMLSSGNALAVTITNGGFYTNYGNLISSGGHYFVITGVADNGNVTIVDPANSNNTDRTVNLENLAAHNHNSLSEPSFWVVYK